MLKGSPDHNSVSGWCPGAIGLLRLSSPSIFAGLLVVHLILGSGGGAMPIRRPAAAAFAAAILSRWPSAGESECIITQTPALSSSGASARTASCASSLNPHQSAQTAAHVPASRNRPGILYASVA